MSPMERNQTLIDFLEPAGTNPNIKTVQDILLNDSKFILQLMQKMEEKTMTGAIQSEVFAKEESLNINDMDLLQ